MQDEIHILFPKQNHEMEAGTITFSVNYLKCRTVAVMYYILHCFDYEGNEINNPFYTGERWAIDETWSSYHDSFELSEDDLEEIYQIQLELVLINVDDDNPCYFTEMMFQNGEFEDYHYVNDDLVEADIGFVNNSYVNVYTTSGNYLQIIRPKRKPFTSNVLSATDLTVLAPHIEGEPLTDKPENLFVEFIYQTEQTTNIKPI